MLVKLVRVLANMSIHPAVGPALASNAACIQLLMETLGEEGERTWNKKAALFWLLLYNRQMYKRSDTEVKYEAYLNRDRMTTSKMISLLCQSK